MYPNNDDPLDDTPKCLNCGHQIGIQENSLTQLQGQWMYSEEYGTTVFVLDPDTELAVIQLNNGQLALIPDRLGYPTVHTHRECFELMASEDLGLDDDDDFDIYPEVE